MYWWQGFLVAMKKFFVSTQTSPDFWQFHNWPLRSTDVCYLIMILIIVNWYISYYCFQLVILLGLKENCIYDNKLHMRKIHRKHLNMYIIFFSLNPTNAFVFPENGNDLSGLGATDALGICGEEQNRSQEWTTEQSNRNCEITEPRHPGKDQRAVQEYPVSGWTFLSLEICGVCSSVYCV